MTWDNFLNLYRERNARRRYLEDQESSDFSLQTWRVNRVKSSSSMHVRAAVGCDVISRGTTTQGSSSSTRCLIDRDSFSVPVLIRRADSAWTVTLSLIRCKLISARSMFVVLQDEDDRTCVTVSGRGRRYVLREDSRISNVINTTKSDISNQKVATKAFVTLKE